MSRRTALALVLLVTLVACRNTRVKVFDHTIAGGSAAQDIRPLRYGAGLPAESLDPNGAAGWSEAAALLHARLFTFDEQGRVVEDLVAETTIADAGTRYRLRLRDRLRFHDGSKVGAADVVATVRDVLARQDSEVGAQLGALRSIEAVAEDAVELRLAHPLPELPAILTELAILPATAAEDHAAWDARPVGAGCYRLVSAEEGLWFFEAHDDFHLGTPKTAFVTLVLIEDDAARAEALSQGLIDLSCVKPDGLKHLANPDRFRIHNAQTGVIRAVPLDLSAPGLDDPQVRRALSALIDREALVTDALGGLGRPAYQILAPRNPAFDPRRDRPSLDPDAARRALDAAGWARDATGIRRCAGIPLRVRLVAWQGESFRRLAGPLIVNAWRAEGIDATLVPVDHARYTRLARDLHGHAEGFVGGWSSLSSPVTVLAKKFGSDGGQNRLGFVDPLTDALLARAAAEESLGPRVSLVHQVLERLEELSPWIPLVYADALFASSTRVEGFEVPVVDSWYEVTRHLWKVGVTP